MTEYIDSKLDALSNALSDKMDETRSVGGAIDEKEIMSLRTYLDKERGLQKEIRQNARKLLLSIKRKEQDGPLDEMVGFVTSK